jgi:mRNA-degrading endonuclease toxin of MazEF toxin-antitoxin module
VSQIKSVDKNSIREKIGTLTKEKMAAVEEGIRLILDF